MDSYLYQGYSHIFPSGRKFALTVANTFEFLQKLFGGQYSGFQPSGAFFQESQDYLIDVTYYPIRQELFYYASETDEQAFPLGAIAIPLNNDAIMSEQPYINWFTFTLSTLQISLSHYYDYAPYRKITLYCPFFESIDIPISTLLKNNSVYGYLSLDFRNNALTLFVYVGDVLITQKTSKVGISLPLGKTNADEQIRNRILHSISAIGSGMAVGVGIATGNPISLTAGVGMATKTAVQALADTNQKIISYSGIDGNTGGLCVDKTIRVVIEDVQPVVTPTDSVYRHTYGLPLKAPQTLSTLNGFTQVSEVHITEIPNATDEEISMIENELKNGVIL